MVIEAIAISVLMMVAAGFSAVTGFGTSTISIPILLFFYTIPQALLFVGIMRLVGSLCKIFMFRKRFEWRLLVLLGIPAILASAFAAKMLLKYSDYISKQVLGGLLIFYVIFIFLKPHFTLSTKSPVAMGGGILTGLSAGVFGISGPVQSAFLSAFDLPKLTYIFTTALLDCMVDISRLSVYLSDGIKFGPILLFAIVLSIPSVFLGVWLAHRVVNRIPQAYFRLVLLIFFCIVGLRWLIWG